MTPGTLYSLAIAFFLLLALVTGTMAAWVWEGPPAYGANLTVTTTGDGGQGSLRQALADANSGDTIDIPPGTYTLTLGTELTIDESLTLNGAGSGDTIIQAATSSADATSRVFNIFGLNVVDISDVTVQNGNTTGIGGGIRNFGTLTLAGTTVSSNAAGSGGGIFNFGDLTLTNGAVNNNTAVDGAGGIENVSTSGTLSLINTIVSGNNGTDGGGLLNLGTVTVTDSTIIGNESSLFGGGIYNPVGQVTLTNTKVSSNV